MEQGRLPNLLIIGAAKAGTTSLHTYLAGHPDAFMSEIKEPRFFAYEQEQPEQFGGPGADRLIAGIVKTPAEYEALFEGAGDRQVVGESSPAYLYSPVAARKISETIPDAKIVAVLRDPADRAYSHWIDNVADGWEPVHEFDRALDLAQQRRQQNWWRKWDYVGHGFYAQQLSRYLELFPREQVKVFLFDELFGPPDTSIGALLEFLNLDPSKLADNEVGRANAGGLPRSRALAALASRRNLVRSSLRMALPARARARLRTELTRRNTTKPALDEATRGRLQDIYHDDIRELEHLLDRDLSAWLRPRAQ